MHLYVSLSLAVSLLLAMFRYWYSLLYITQWRLDIQYSLLQVNYSANALWLCYVFSADLTLFKQSSDLWSTSSLRLFGWSHIVDILDSFVGSQPNGVDSNSSGRGQGQAQGQGQNPGEAQGQNRGQSQSQGNSRTPRVPQNRISRSKSFSA